jgi:GT2 family glycosyltransferase
MSQHSLFVIIPVHNRKEASKECLKCLTRQSLPGFKVLVVDDGSTDGTQDMLKHDFPEVIRLEGDGNLFWTGGTNLGVQYALDHGADLIVTLNNDVLVKEDYLETLVEAHRKSPTALIGSINLTQEEPRRLLYAGIESLNYWTAKSIKRGRVHQMYNGEFSGLLPTYSLPGRGVLIPRKVFDTIGLYDEKYFRHYAADYDFSLRANDAGFDLLIHMGNPVFSPYEPDRTGGRGQTLFSFIKSFFKFRSPNYLPVVFRYNFRHCPHKWYFPVFAVLNFGRTFGSFLLRK